MSTICLIDVQCMPSLAGNYVKCYDTLGEPCEFCVDGDYYEAIYADANGILHTDGYNGEVVTSIITATGTICKVYDSEDTLQRTFTMPTI